MFKLSEVRDVWTRVWGAGNPGSSGSVGADDADINVGVTQIVDVVEQLFDQLLAAVSE